jgi:hypothetical protein
LIQEVSTRDSLIARWWHAADFFNSIDPERTRGLVGLRTCELDRPGPLIGFLGTQLKIKSPMGPTENGAIQCTILLTQSPPRLHLVRRSLWLHLVRVLRNQRAIEKYITNCSDNTRNFLDSVRDSPRSEDLTILAMKFPQIVEGLSASACKGRSPARTVRQRIAIPPRFCAKPGRIASFRSA